MYQGRQYRLDNAHAPGKSNTGYFYTEWPFRMKYFYCSVSLSTPILTSKYPLRKRRQKTTKLHLKK